MARLVLTLSQPLGLADAAALPDGVVVDNTPQGARVTAELPSDLAAAVALTAGLARALPQAEVSVEGDAALVRSASARPAADASTGGATSEEAASEKAASGEAAAAPAAPAPAATAADDPWELVTQGRHDEALAAVSGGSLDSRGRDVVRELANSTDPAEVALACRIAAATDWRSFVSPMRRLLDHADSRVKIAAVEAIGMLGGPAMSWQLEKRAEGASPDLKAAIDAAVAAIEGRQG